MSYNYKGTITLIIGPMFSGKTTELIRLSRRSISIGKKVIYVKYYKDNRFTETAHIVSRDNTQDTTNKAIISIGNSLENTLLNAFSNNAPSNNEQCDIICIDEIQFYEDGAEICDKYANLGYELIVSGLQGTFDRKYFETIAKLIPMSENIIHLKALDILSGNECSFTKRIGNDTDLFIVGNNELYHPCDRFNYFNDSVDSVDLI